MSNICKTVSLRTRKIKDGRMLSYYLDYYPGYRDESTMKVIRHESLGIYIYAKPKNQTEQTSSKNVSPVGQNYSPRMKFNSQTKPLTPFSLLLTICHVAQIHTFRLVVLMVVPTNLRIGTEHRRQDWELLHV